MSYRRQPAPAHMISPDSLLAHPHRYFFLKIRKQRLREVKRLPHSHTALIPFQGGGGEYGTPSWVLSAMSKKTSLKDPRPITQVVNSLSNLGRAGGEATPVALVRECADTGTCRHGLCSDFRVLGYRDQDRRDRLYSQQLCHLLFKATPL